MVVSDPVITGDMKYKYKLHKFSEANKLNLGKTYSNYQQIRQCVLYFTQTMAISDPLHSCSTTGFSVPRDCGTQFRPPFPKFDIRL